MHINTFHIIIGLTLFGIVQVCIIFFYKRKDQKRIKEHKSYQKEVEASNQTLSILNQELNTSLQALKQANDKLSHYAFKNSHEVRAPLSRLLGLINILELSSSKTEQEFILKQIVIEAQDLDIIIKEMNVVLEELIIPEGT